MCHLTHFRALSGGGCKPEHRGGCKAYELCPFNDGDRFCWTPQAHLVSKVYLKKHPTLPFCYTINAKDKKMVNDFVKARSS